MKFILHALCAAAIITLAPIAVTAAPAASEASSACSSTGAEDCLMQGVAAEEAEDYTKAFALYDKGCKSQDSRSCSQLGDMYANGRGVAHDFALALPLYTKACSGGALKACNKLGDAYADGSDVTQDMARSTRYYETACQGHELTGCYNAAAAYAGGGMPANYPHAFSLFAQACQDGQAESCTATAKMYMQGMGVAKDTTKAQSFNEQGCLLGDPTGCEMAGTDQETLQKR
jgi:uncharacterized protein